jgi:hypothetical protein
MARAPGLCPDARQARSELAGISRFPALIGTNVQVSPYCAAHFRTSVSLDKWIPGAH